MTTVRLMILMAAACAAGSVRTVVTGTGDSSRDVALVQAAVDQGGQVVLRGHFSFDRTPAQPLPPAAMFPRMAMVLVTKEVVISGIHDSGGGMTTIDGGTWPFAVEAPGVPVAIQSLRFVRPKAGAIQVNAVSGLTIADCRIEGVEPVANPDLRGVRVGMGIGVSTLRIHPTLAEPGQPENISGILSIINNDIDAAGAASGDDTVGVLIFSAGKLPGQPVDVYVSGNRIRNVTQRAVNLRQIGGRAYIERNVIATGSISGAQAGVSPDVIHVFGAGSYLVAHNSIQCDWAKGAGIRVHGGFAEWPINGAIVMDNDVNMAAPESTVFDAYSAGIEIRGYAKASVVLNNRLRGRGRAALAVMNRDAGVPENSMFGWNDIEGFQPAGRKSKVLDEGIGTVIVKQGGKGK